MGLFSRAKAFFSGSANDQYQHALPGGIEFITVTDGAGNVTAELHSSNEHRDAYYSNAFRACELAKCRPLASLPVHVYRRRDGIRETPSYRFCKRYETILRTKWNPFMSASEGTRWAMMTKDIKGNAFMRLEVDGAGLPVAIWPLAHKPVVEVYNGRPVFRYGGDKFTKPGCYLDSEIIWVKSPILDPDCLYGVSLAELAARELGLSIDLEEFYARTISGEGTFPGWLETQAKLDKQDYETLKKQLGDGGGIVRAGKLRIFDKGLTYKSNSQNMADMSLVEQEKWILQQTCRTLSVPPQEVYDLSHATYSNVEQGALDFANKTLMPECDSLERALSAPVWAAGYEDCYVQVDMNGLLRGLYKDRMEGYRIAINAGFFCANDARAKEDLPPFVGGEVFFRQSSMVPVDPETGEELAERHNTSLSSAPADGPKDPDTADASDVSGTALAVIHKDMRDRLRDRLEDKGDSPKLREFAEKVLTPLADAYEVAGIEYDLQSDIEEIING